MENYTKSFRCYRPNKAGNGVASEWQLSFKEKEKYEKYLCFLTLCPQTGTDENGNASFDWKEKAIRVKIGEADLGELISVLEGRKDQLGPKGSLYHSTDAGSKVITLNKGDNGFYLKVSAQNQNKETTSYSHVISQGEASVLLVLLRQAVVKIFGW